MSNDGIVAMFVIVCLAATTFYFAARSDVANKRAVKATAELVAVQGQLDLERRLRAADQAAVASTTKKLNALKAQKGKQDVQLKAALVAERQWADAPVPDSVRAALRVRHDAN